MSNVKLSKKHYGFLLKLKGKINIEDIYKNDVYNCAFDNKTNLLIDCSEIESFDKNIINKIPLFNLVENKNKINKLAVVYKTNAQIIDITNILQPTNKRDRYISTMFNKCGIEKAEKYLQFGEEP